MPDSYATRLWSNSGSEYAGSLIHTWLNESWLALLDSDVQTLARSVKLPYVQNSAVYSGENGLSAKVFLLSAVELGWTSSYKSGIPADGVCLDYFEQFEDEDAGRLGSSSTWYWTRSPDTTASEKAWVAAGSSGAASRDVYTSYGVRPALVLPSTLTVNESGALQPNTAPVITSPSGASGTNLGVKSGPFTFSYTTTDPEGTSLTLTEMLDGSVTRTLTAASGAEQSFEALADNTSFLKLTNSAHTLQVTASDGMASATLTAASLTLAQPLVADGPIAVAVLEVSGSIPADAAFSVQVTNNALDEAPVWQDATDAVRQRDNILFTNKTAANTPAFNFRIQVSRGSSGEGGYIDGVSGAFQ